MNERRVSPTLERKKENSLSFLFSHLFSCPPTAAAAAAAAVPIPIHFLHPPSSSTFNLKVDDDEPFFISSKHLHANLIYSISEKVNNLRIPTHRNGGDESNVYVRVDVDELLCPLLLRPLHLSCDEQRDAAVGCCCFGLFIIVFVLRVVVVVVVCLPVV